MRGIDHRRPRETPTGWCSTSIRARASAGRTWSRPRARCASGSSASSSKASSRPPAARACTWCCRSSPRLGTRPRISAHAVAERMEQDAPTATCRPRPKAAAQQPHLRRLSAQQPRGDRGRALLHPRAAGRAGVGADRLVRAWRAEGRQPVHRVKTCRSGCRACARIRGPKSAASSNRCRS